MAEPGPLISSILSRVPSSQLGISAVDVPRETALHGIPSRRVVVPVIDAAVAYPLIAIPLAPIIKF